MLLYLIGAVMLELCVLSFGAHHYLRTRDDPSPGVMLYVALFTLLPLDYLIFERVHLYTYDFVAERVGFKLGWGCLVFYPFFYCIGLWDAAEQPNPHSPGAAGSSPRACCSSPAGCSRAAPTCRSTASRPSPSARPSGRMPQRALVSGDKRVLVSGFWGLSRHVNYLGELLMATALALCLGYPAALLPWLYPLYYVALLVPRQLDDDRRCAEKYGPLWDEYRRAVPQRIVPFLY